MAWIPTSDYFSLPHGSGPVPEPVSHSAPSGRALESRMKVTLWHAAALGVAALFLARGGYGAQLAVLGVTLGIFFGTLSLQRPAAGDATTTNPGHG